MSENTSATEQVVAELAKVATLTPEALRVIYAFVYANGANLSRLESRVEDLEEEIEELLPLVRDPQGNSVVSQVRSISKEVDALNEWRRSMIHKEQSAYDDERKKRGDDDRARLSLFVTGVIAVMSMILTLINLVSK